MTTQPPQQPAPDLPQSTQGWLHKIDMEKSAAFAQGYAQGKYRQQAQQPAPEPALQPTPSSHWLAAGEPDPHGARYDCERSALAMGKLTDDELANGAFMNYDMRPPLQDIIDGKANSPIAWMTAVKDRIRWLSRSLEKALALPQQAAPADQLVAALEQDAARWRYWRKALASIERELSDGTWEDRAPVSQLEQFSALRRFIQEAGEDARRYRWLRDEADDAPADENGDHLGPRAVTGQWWEPDVCEGEHLDRAIDAARKQEPDHAT